METTKLLAGKTNILGHGSTHSNARHMGPTAHERRRQTTYTIRTLYFFKVILTTCSRRISKNRPICGLVCRDLSARVPLVLFCVCFASVPGPHSREGLKLAERVFLGYASRLCKNDEVTKKFRYRHLKICIRLISQIHFKRNG
jgi:hypothetical protein